MSMSVWNDFLYHPGGSIMVQRDQAYTVHLVQLLLRFSKPTSSMCQPTYHNPQGAGMHPHIWPHPRGDWVHLCHPPHPPCTWLENPTPLGVAGNTPCGGVGAQSAGWFRHASCFGAGRSVAGRDCRHDDLQSLRRCGCGPTSREFAAFVCSGTDLSFACQTGRHFSETLFVYRSFFNPCHIKKKFTIKISNIICL